MHATITKNLQSLSAQDLKHLTTSHVEQMGERYVKRFGLPALNAQALMIGYIIRDHLQSEVTK